MSNPTKVFRVRLWRSLGGSKIVVAVNEYDVVNVTEKSYMIKETKVLNEGEQFARLNHEKRRPRNLPKVAIDVMDVDISNIDFIHAGVWVFGNTGMWTDKLANELIAKLDEHMGKVQKLVNELQLLS